MKNIKKCIAVILVLMLCFGMTACSASRQTTTTISLETSADPMDGEAVQNEMKDPADYDDDIHGLCAFLRDCKVTAGESIQMEYGVIGAVNGYKFTYGYNSSNVQLEVYEFPTEELSEEAQNVIGSVRENGSFDFLDGTIPAILSADGRYMLIYTDAKAEKEDANKVHKAHVLDCFEAFTAE